MNTSTPSLRRPFGSGLILLALGLASTGVLAQTPVFQFGPTADYISGKPGFDHNTPTPRYESGNQPFRHARTGEPQTEGARPYTEAHPITGPSDGINVGGSPTRRNFQTWSNYAGPALFGGYTVTHDSTATFSSPRHLPFIGYGTTDATSTSGVYFETGMRNGRADSRSLDRLAVNGGFSPSSGTTLTSGIRAFSIVALFTAQLSPPVKLTRGSSLAYVIGGSSQGTVYVRAVVKIGSQYYVSDFANRAESGPENHGRFDFAQLSTGTWSRYYPIDEIPYESYNPDTLDLSNISFAGVLLTRSLSEPLTAGDSLPGYFVNVSLIALSISTSASP